MKRHFVILFAISVSIVSFSCRSEKADEYARCADDASLSTTIRLPDALNSLDEMIRHIDATTKAGYQRSYNPYDIVSIGASSFAATKVAGLGFDIPKTLFYLVNFDNADGFAVLAADTRLGESVYCLTEDGSIDSDAFVRAFDYLHSGVSQTRTEEMSEDIEHFSDIGKDFVPTLLLSSMLADLKYGKIVEETKSTPVATYNNALLETKWNQGDPFNMYLPIIDGDHCAAGCVAIACAQIMQYCQKPVNPVFDGVSCSWNTMGTVKSIYDLSGSSASTSAKQQCGHFLKHIGQPSLIYIRYNQGSYGYADGVVRTLKYYGYTNVKKRLGFGATNQGRASQQLSNNLPVYLDGSDSRRVTGHAWVIDGEWNNYFHCNWGWNGIWDGYYAKNNYFPISSRAYIDSTDPDFSSSTHENNDYDWNFRMVTYSL